MSPHVDDLFSGHYFPDDPRGPLFAAGGCIWPTVPGYNLFIGSTDAWGTLAWLNTLGIQLKPDPLDHAHDEAQWILNGGVAPVTVAFLRKLILPENRGFTWKLEFNPLIGNIVQVEETYPVTKCNRSFLLPEFTHDNIPTGGSGANCRILQVEWDATRPPDGWPPTP